jgi:putative oxidoreductase
MPVVARHPRGYVHAHHDPDAAQWALEQDEQEELREADRVKARQEALYMGGRLIIALVFVTGALAKALAFREAGGGLFVWLTIALELIAGSLLGLGLFARRAAIALLCWTGIGVVFFHGDLTVDINRAFLLCNLAMGGALFVLAAHGGGMLSLDRVLDKRALSAES